MVGRVILAAAAFLALTGCSGGADVADAQKSIAAFRQQMAAEDYDGIWNGSAPDMQQATPKADLARFLKAVHDKLGAAKETKQIGWNVNYNTAGTFTTLTYHTSFAKGSGDEQFLFKGSGAAMKLAGYHVNSMELVTN